MQEGQEQTLPVLHPVTDYEKIKRVGEGTYGVVCTAAMNVDQSEYYTIVTSCDAEEALVLQTRQGTGELVTLWLSRSSGWTENAMVCTTGCLAPDAYSSIKIRTQADWQVAGLFDCLFGSHRHASHLCPRAQSLTTMPTSKSCSAQEGGNR